MPSRSTAEHFSWLDSIRASLEANPREALKRLSSDGAVVDEVLRGLLDTTGRNEWIAAKHLLTLGAQVYAAAGEVDGAATFVARASDVATRFAALAEGLEAAANRALESSDTRVAEACIVFLQKQPQAHLRLLGATLDVKRLLGAGPTQRLEGLARIDAATANPGLPDSFGRALALALADLGVRSCARREFEHANRYLSLIPRWKPSAFQELHEWLSYAAKDFLKSPAYRKGVGSMVPKEAVLAKAYDTASTSPLETLRALETPKKPVKDVVDLLAVQHFCLSQCCHEGPPAARADFQKRRDTAKKALMAQMTKAGVDQPRFWKFQGISSFDEIP